MSDIEIRSVVEPVEFRAADGHIVASGVAMRYGAKSKLINGRFRERFAPGAFTKTLQEQDIRSHNEHNGPYLGRSGAGTLRLIDSRSELRYEVDLPDTTAGRDTAALLERGDIKGSSIGFRALPTAITWDVDDDGKALRSVSEARLFRVDLTTAPYYDDSTAEVALRSFAEQKGLELRSVLEAVDGGSFATLLESPADDTDDGRDTTVVRQRISWLF